MTKNIKSIFFVLTFVMLLVTVGAVCAADDANSTITTDTSVSDVTTVSDSASDTVTTESVTTKSNDNEIDTKTIEKEEKNIKNEVIDGVDYDHIYENMNVYGYFGVYDGNAYFNNCTFNQSSTYYLYAETITFNDCKVLKGNLYGSELRLIGNNTVDFTNANLGFDRIIGNLTISDCTFNSDKNLPGNFTIENSIINSTLNGKNYGNLTIGENVTLTDNAKFDNFVNIYSDNFEELIPHLTYLTGNLILEDQTIVNKGNKGNLTLIKSVINSQFENMINSNITLINGTINNSINNANNANIYVMNSTINGIIDNYGNLTIENTVINKMILNKGNLTIGDNVTFCDDFKIYGTGEIITNDTEKITHYLESYNLGYIEVTDFNSFKNALGSSTVYRYNDVYKIKLLEGTYSSNQWEIVDMSPTYIDKTLIIEGNNQIINAKDFRIQKKLKKIIVNNLTLNFAGLNNNNGILEVNNCTINTSIVNNGGTLIIDDNTIIDSKATFSINDIVINDIYRILPYTTKISNISVENFTFTNDVQLNGTVRLSNCTLESTITNSGNLTLNNSILNKQITNNGNLTLINCTIDENTFRISGNGNVTCDDLVKYFPYITYVKGEYELNDYTINKSFTNNGQITLKNCILNSTITNNGILIINDETILAENLKINGNGEIIINDTNKIAPYLSTYNGNYTLENMTINTTKSNRGNLTIINSTINSIITNNGNQTIKNSTINSTIRNNANLTIINSTLNSTIQNNGILTISDDCIIGDNCQITGNGQLIMNDTTRVGIYSGNHILNNTVINKTITIPSDGNVTYINSNVTAPITNNGNITFINSNINEKIFNNGNLIIENSSLSNNNITSESLIININNLQMKDSIIANNTLNDIPLINNIQNMTMDNCTVINNTNMSNNYIITNGTIFINNSNFESNTKGIQSTNITVTNTIFYNNKYIYLESGTAGTNAVEPGCIAIKATNLHIDNCTFDSNGIISKHEYATSGGGAGAIGGTNLFVNNSIFKNNIANTTTTWAANSGSGGAIAVTNGEIYNSLFENNSVSNPSTRTIPTIGQEFYGMTLDGALQGTAADIYSSGNIIIINNTFTNSYASNAASSIYSFVYDYNHKQDNITIKNNIFNNTKSSLDTIVIEKISINNVEPIIELENNKYYNNTINDELIVNIPSKTYAGEPITITGTYKILNTSFYDSDILEQNKFQIYINGVLNQTLDTIDFNIIPTSGNMILTIQPTITQTKKTQMIRSTTLTNITITPENYNEYIYDGELIGVDVNSKITFKGTFTEKEIYININDIILDGTNATFTNSRFILENENITLQNMNITNTETEYPIVNNANNNIINHNTITLTNTNGKTSTIYNTASNTIISNNTLYVDGPAETIDFSTGEGVANTQAILLIGGNNNTVEYNNITATSNGTNSIYGTIEAITNSKNATNTLIQHNNLNSSGGNFNYAIDSLNNVQNITIQENNIIVTGERYTDGIQVGNSAKNILIKANNITCICQNTTPVDEEAITYGIITTNMGNGISENITIQENMINLTGTANYGMEIYQTTNTQILNNTITVNGPQSMGIGYAHSPNANITSNIITTNGDSTIPLTSVTEEIQPANIGIKIQQNSDNIIIENNTINTFDVGKQDITIKTEDLNTIITNNQLTSSTGYGEDTITTNQQDTIIENNMIETTITTEDITTLIKQPTTLTATVTTTDGDNINGGTVTFTDANGNTIATATVNNGTATATATFTQADESTITATYTPTSTGLTESTTTATLTVKDKFQTTITIDEITATAGETITLKANVLDENGDAVTGGKVTFKVNGKTVKDANGKVVYAKVVDGVATAQYTVPENLGGQDITVTAVYSGTNKYSKETTTITTTVTAPEAKLTITPITSDVQTGSTVTLKAKVAIGDKAITTGKIVFKVNGKTVKDENGKVIYAKVDANGEISVDYTIPESFKAGTYNIEAVFTASGYDKLTDNTTMTVVKS